MRMVGRFTPPGDKSISHRIALMSLIAHGSCLVRGISNAKDVDTTLKAVRALGGGVRKVPGGLLLEGTAEGTGPTERIWCGNSGTTMRLLMGILSSSLGTHILDGDPSLRRRPMERVARPLSLMGARIKTTNGGAPVTVEGGPLNGIEYRLPVASAQLKSALILAATRAHGPTTIWEPVPSRDHTERIMRLCGGRILRLPGGLQIQSSQLTLPEEFDVPGDISSAAFLLCGAAILPGSDLVARNVGLNPLRTGFLDVLSRMGVDVLVEVHREEPEPQGDVRVKHHPHLEACEVRPNEVPGLIDEIPILALVASQAQGTSRFMGVGELRHKESDRVSSIVSQLGLLGANIRVEGEDLLVEGPTRLSHVPRVSSFGDHRIAMTLRIASLLCGQEIYIEEEGCTEISYPDFHSTLEGLLR
jgi:3-phosphoshikimate 1-carboxyvinyltransferase